MKDIESNKASRIYLLVLTIGFLLSQVLLCFQEEVIEEDVWGTTVFSIVLLVFVVLTMIGFKWARWVLSSLLVFYAIPLSCAGFMIPSFSNVLIGLYCFFFGLAIHHPKLKSSTPTSIDQASEAVDLSNYELPYLIDRYKAALIDNLLVVCLVILIAYGFDQFNINTVWSVIVGLFILLAYEPILVSYSNTIGQAIMNIRVRNLQSPESRIKLASSYLRFLTKIILGILSFITISFNKNKRAIHDFAGSSITIKL